MSKRQENINNLYRLIESTKKRLLELKYSNDTIRRFSQVWGKFLEYAEKMQIDEYSVELSETFLKETYDINVGLKLHKKDYVKARAMQILTNFYLNKAISLRRKQKNYICPNSFKSEVDAFMEYKSQNQISVSRLNSISYALKKFVSHLSQNRINNFSELNNEKIHAFIRTLADYSKTTIRNILQIIREFLSFLYQNKYLDQNLSFSVPHIKYSKNNSIPSVYSQEEIIRLLKSVDRKNPIGKRDYAILLMAAKLGLRTSEVKDLKLKDLNWETSQIKIIQAKTGQMLNIPILEDVGFAIIDYLKNGRPNVKNNNLFLKHVPPYDSLSKVGIYDIVQKYFHRANIKIPKGKKHGLHSLRHSLASQLLEKNTPVPVISEILGHLNSNTTGVYLKVDIKKLRTCSLEVPDGIN